MVDVNSNINIKLKGSDVKLNKQTLSGAALSKETPLFMKKYDKNNDGVISQKETVSMLNDLKKASGNDILSEREFEQSKLGTKEDYAKIEKATAKKAGTTTTVEGKNKLTTTRSAEGTMSMVRENTETKSKNIRNYDENGNLISQQTISSKGTVTSQYKYDGDGNELSENTVIKDAKGNKTISYQTTYNYDEFGHNIGSEKEILDKYNKPLSNEVIKIKNNADGNPIEESFVATDSKTHKIIKQQLQTNEYNAEGTLTTSRITTTKEKSKIVVNKKYQSDGKTLASTSQDVFNKDNSTAHTDQTYNANGKAETKHTVVKDKSGNVTSDLNSKFQYASDGKTISSAVTTGSRDAHPYNEEIKYDAKGKMASIDTTFYKRGEKVEDHYEGANLENRQGYLPSKSIEYEADGKTIKKITVNKFDKDGVLISDEIQDKDGKTVSTHDYSKVDGKFDTAFQKGRGDCYLLSGLNAINESSEGKELLKKTVTIGKDPKTGETTYTVNFPGAKQVREKLLAQGVPADKIDINDSYTYTESQVHEKAKQSGTKYSSGDKDVLLLEVAYEDYRTALKDDAEDLHVAKPNLKPREIQTMLHIRGLNAEDKNDNLRSGQGGDAVFMLTGKEPEEFIFHGSSATDKPVCNIDADLNMTVAGSGNKLTPQQSTQIDSMLDTMEQDYKKDGKLDQYAGTAGFTVGKQTINGKVEADGGHSFSISKVDGDTVYLRNPWDPTKEITMTREEFKKAATSFAVTPLDDNAHIAHDNGNNGNSDGVHGHSGNGGGSVGGSGDGDNNGNHDVSDTPQAGKKFQVSQGKGYKTLLREALIAQGIEPTSENMKKASEQFKVANEGAVQTYKGSNSKYKGNEFLYKDAVVVIPQFDIKKA